MSFSTEAGYYEKSIISDLQGAWECLRTTTVNNAGFNDWDRLLFHINEAMSWESVRDLKRIEPLLTLIRNIATRANAPDEVKEAIDEVAGILSDVLQGAH